MLRRIFGFQSTQFVMAAVLMGLVGFQLLYIDSYILTASASESLSEFLLQNTDDVAEMTTTVDESHKTNTETAEPDVEATSDVPLTELTVKKVQLTMPAWLMYVAFSTAAIFLFLGFQTAKKE